MKVVTKRAIAGEDDGVALSLRPRSQVYVRDVPVRPSRRGVPEWHDHLLGLLHGWSIPALRLALGFVFLWFGALKLLGASPVVNMLEHTYTFLPVHSFAAALGVWEVLVGVGLMMKRALRCTLGLLCLHLAGTFVALALAPALFFHEGNPLWLTAEGEFVVKNTVLVAAALVIGGHEVEPLGGRGTATAEPPAYKR